MNKSTVVYNSSYCAIDIIGMVSIFTMTCVFLLSCLYYVFDKIFR